MGVLLSWLLRSGFDDQSFLFFEKVESNDHHS
jgi:hypothetical protein